MAWDIHQGFDACDPKDFPPAETFDFIWAHPPYWRKKLYADDPRDLSRAPTLEHFLRRYGQFIRNCRNALKPGGKLAILMGDYSDREAGYVPLVYHTKRLAFAAGLTQHCTDIIRFSHGDSSSKKVYRSQLHPRPARRLHDLRESQLTINQEENDYVGSPFQFRLKGTQRLGHCRPPLDTGLLITGRRQNPGLQHRRCLVHRATNRRARR